MDATGFCYPNCVGSRPAIAGSSTSRIQRAFRTKPFGLHWRSQGCDNQRGDSLTPASDQDVGEQHVRRLDPEYADVVGRAAPK
jgi:hypothetical protein